MTLLWGEIEVPELTYVPIKLGKSRDPDNRAGLFHQTTGLRMEPTSTLEETRGGGQLDYLLFGPKDEGWTVRVITQSLGAYLPRQVGAQLGLSSPEFSALPFDERKAHEMEFLRLHGYDLECKQIIPEGDGPPARWSAERRDSLVMMIFYYREVYRDRGPFPSKLTLRSPGLHEELRGTFRNPIWERLTVRHAPDRDRRWRGNPP